MHAILALVTRARRAVPTHALRRVALATASLSLAPLAACGGGDGGGDATGPAATGRGALRLTNSSGISAWYVYVKSCSATTWGADRMGDGVLSSGESATLNLDAGCYDLRAESSPSNNKRFEQLGVQIADDQTKQVTITSWQDK